jgi:hypothetical protein
MAQEYVYLKMVKPWGGFNVGDIVRFGWNKGQARIEKGEGIEVPKQRAVNDPQPLIRERPRAETMISNPQSEKAVVSPELADPSETDEPKDETKARSKKKRSHLA